MTPKRSLLLLGALLALSITITSCRDGGGLSDGAGLSTGNLISTSSVNPASEARVDTTGKWRRIFGNGGFAIVRTKMNDQNPRGNGRRQGFEAFAEWTRQLDSVYVKEADLILGSMLVEIKSEKSYRRLVNNPFVKSVSRSGAPESGPFFFGNGCGSQPPVSPHNIWYVGGEAIGRDIKEHGVEAAWLRAQGSGVSIGVVGTGVSKFQTQLSYDFLNGQSATRSPINRDYVWDDGDADPSHDNCGHETKLIGIMAAPRDGIGLVGIAYKSNIHSIRMDNDVSLQNGFWRAKLAIRKASTTSKIINMAFGWHELAPWDADEREDLEEEIARLYNLDYLLIGAAGTSLTVTSWMDVVFPANVFGVVAVTGIGPDGNRCPTCHAGTKVEFVAEIHQPTLHPNPDLSSSSYTLVNSGGSSHATAVISAMAAVIWSKYPGYSRDYILYRMRLAGGRSSAHPKTGWGTPNLYRAVGGIYDAELSGPSAVDAGSGLHGYTFSHQGGDGPFTYEWSNGSTETYAEYDFTHSSVGQFEVAVKVTDTSDGFYSWSRMPVMVTCPGGMGLCPDGTCGDNGACMAL